jgi:hypothetical protein
MKFKFLCILIFIIQIANSQNVNIEKLELSNELFINSINNFVKKRKKESPKFKNLGYVEVRLLYVNNEAINDELKYKFIIVDQYYRPNRLKQNLPKYYFYIEDKLVLLYNELEIYNTSSNSKKHQRKIDRLIKPYLNEPTHLKVKNEDGKIIINDRNFRDESFNIHGGIKLYINADNSTNEEK